MQESGLPVTNGYISDIHGNEHIPGLTACNGAPAALGSGEPVLRRPGAVLQPGVRRPSSSGWPQTASRPRTRCSSSAPTKATTRPARTSAGPSSPPRPTATAPRSAATRSPRTVACTYPAGSFGELAGNLTGLLATQKSNTTPFTLENDTAPEFYVTGQPGPTAPPVRTLERDVAGLTASNPYSGNTNEKITNYLADPAEEAHPAHGQRRPGQDADLRDVRQAGLLPQRRLGHLQSGRASPRTRVSPGTTVTTPPRSTPTGSASPGRAWPTSAWTARPADAGPSSAGPNSARSPSRAAGPPEPGWI